MQGLRRYIRVTITAIAVFSVVGVLIATLLVLGIEIKSTQSIIDTSAASILAIEESQENEVNSLLDSVNASNLPYCSDAEIIELRKLVFKSEFVRDIGHISDGRIQCSATLGNQNLPTTQYKPVGTMVGGLIIYRSLSPYQPDSPYGLGEQIGNSFIEMDIRLSNRLNAIYKNRVIALYDPKTLKTTYQGLQLPVDHGVISYKNWDGRVGSTLFATRCSTKYYACVTTFASLPESIQAKRDNFVIYSALGALIGALIGLLYSRLYLNNRSMEQQLRRAIRTDKLTLLYQPIIHLKRGKMVGAEALVRWKDEDGFEVRPDVFVKLAEERGFVFSITKLVVRHALRDLGNILRDHPDFQLNINVTASDLADPDLIPFLERSLTRVKVQAKSLVIEITETSTARQQTAIETILKLRAMGHSVIIDDFGTGYSSLSYLHELAINGIKIDKVFTQAIGTGALILSIVPQILALADALDFYVIVEGVETHFQALYFANSVKPVLAQGWLFGYPVPAEEFKKKFQANLEHALLKHLPFAVPSYIDNTEGESSAAAKPADTVQKIIDKIPKHEMN